MYPLSAYYEQEAKPWMRNHPGKVVTLYEVGQLFGSAFQRAASNETAVNAFKNTGRVPFNPRIFPDELFSPSETTDRPEAYTLPTETLPASPARVDEPSPILQSTAQPSISESLSRPSTPQPGCSTNVTSPPTKEKKHSQDSLYYSPYDILPLPKAKPREQKNYKRGKIMILTSTPNMEDIKQSLTQKYSSKIMTIKKRVNLETHKSVKQAKKRSMIGILNQSRVTLLCLRQNLCDDSSDLDIEEMEDAEGNI